MAKSTRVTFELPPASHRVLEQAAQENGINVQAAASLILQAALARGSVAWSKPVRKQRTYRARWAAVTNRDRSTTPQRVQGRCNGAAGVL